MGYRNSWPRALNDSEVGLATTSGFGEDSGLIMSESSFVSGYVGLVGRPNAGKSTLVNKIVGQTISAAHAKPQTTRHRVLGIYTSESAQLVFQDTPGLHKPRNELGKFMTQQVDDVISDCDVLLWLIDISRKPGAGDNLILDRLVELNEDSKLPPIVLGFNKIDQLAGREDRLEDYMHGYVELANSRLTEEKVSAWPNTVVSAKVGFGVPQLIRLLTGLMPHGPQYYDEDQVTDQQLRTLAAELIRVSALQYLSDEVPHGIAVDIIEYVDRDPSHTYISAVLYVEQDSHKPMVLGRKGRMIKRIGVSARQAIENVTETRIYLELWVKVRRNWRRNADLVRSFGYS